MSIKGIFKSLTKASDFVNQKQAQPKTATPTFVPATETNNAQKRFEMQNYGNYQRNQLQSQWTNGQINGSQLLKAQTSDVKPMYDGVKTTAELNQKFLETLKAIDPQPTGVKSRKLKSGKMSSGGTSASEAAASNVQSLKRITDNDLKKKFERLGEKYGVPPALIAGIASRESEMGRTTVQSGKYEGWGDPRGGEYHGFGIIQVDKYKAPIPGLTKILQNAHGRQKLDQYAEEHIEWGVKSFLIKLAENKAKFPKLSEANQIATAVSKYNGGTKTLPYPGNDKYTTGHDYANDTLVRARWFANNWDKLK